MRLFHARPPAVSPANPRTFPGLIVYARGSKGTDANSNPDPYRASVIDLSLAEIPEGISCTIGGTPGACQLSGLSLNDGDRVSILWSNLYQVSGNFKNQYGRGDMVYNASSGLLEDDEYTMGHDWTASRWWDEDYEEYVDFTPQNGVVFAYVNCTVHDVCVYWDLAPRWPSGASCWATMVPQTAVVSGPYPDYVPYLANYEGYAWPSDWYWEHEYYNDIFGV